MDKKTLEPSYDRSSVDVWATVCGGVLREDAYGPQLYLPEGGRRGPADPGAGVVCPLPDHGIVAVTGAEAARFLQSQLTNEVERQALDQVALNGYCTAKGRLLATAWQWREDEAVRLVVARPLAAPLSKRLSMFVLRAKARVQDQSSEHVCFGLAGPAIGAVLAELGLVAPAEGGLSRGRDGLVALAQPATTGSSGPLSRVLLIAPVGRLSEIWPILTEQLHPKSSEEWRMTEILAGIPRVSASVSEHFVPQMVNLDLVGGVSFKKGCYPGQEVVARSHYLGKLKRRMFLARVNRVDPPDPGTDIDTAEGGQACGEVVMAARDPAGGVVMLIESQIEQVHAARLNGIPLAIEALPYASA